MTAKKIRVMLADDHALVRAGLKLLLKSDDKIEVVAEASNGLEALEKLESTEIDVVILDISMPQMSGLDCICQIRRRSPKTKILILSMHEDKVYIKNAMNLGAAGYIPKASADDELFDAIHEVAKGNFYLSRNAEQSLLASLFTPKEEQDLPGGIKPLSPREWEVLTLIVRGYSITEIGKLLNLSVKTIDTHKTKIMEKLHCHKKSQLVDFALKHGILTVSN